MPRNNKPEPFAEESREIVGMNLDPNYLPESWDDVAKLYGDEVVEYREPWEVVKKETLVGVPFMIYQFDFREGSYGEMAIVKAVLQDGTRVLFVDGSSGLREQLAAMKGSGRVGGIMCPKGLRVSEYLYDNSTTGKQEPAKTYYLA